MGRFIMDKRYLEAPDDGVVRLGNLSRLLLIAGLGLFAVALVLFIPILASVWSR